MIRARFLLFLYIIFSCWDVYSLEFVLLLYILRSFMFYFRFLLKEVNLGIKTGENEQKMEYRDFSFWFKKSKKQKLICLEGLTEQLFLIKKKILFIRSAHPPSLYLFFIIHFWIENYREATIFIKKLGFLGDNSM